MVIYYYVTDLNMFFTSGFMMNVLHININEYLVTDIGWYVNEQYSHSNCSVAESFSGKLIIYVRR